MPLSMPQPLAMQSPSKKSTRRPHSWSRKPLSTRTRLKSYRHNLCRRHSVTASVSISKAISADRTFVQIALDPKGKVQGCIRFFKCGLIKEDGTLNDAILLGPLSVSTANRGADWPISLSNIHWLRHVQDAWGHALSWVIQKSIANMAFAMPPA